MGYVFFMVGWFGLSLLFCWAWSRFYCVTQNDLGDDFYAPDYYLHNRENDDR